MIEMTDDQRVVLAHVVVDPNAWLENAVKALGEEKATIALRDKVARWERSYREAKASQKDSYKTRAERDEESRY